MILGAALTIIGNYNRAHDHFATALALDQQKVLLNRNLAYLLLREGRAKEAAQRLKISEQIKRAQ